MRLDRTDSEFEKKPKPDEIVFNETKISTSAFFSHPLYSTEDRRHNDIGMDFWTLVIDFRSIPGRLPVDFRSNTGELCWFKIRIKALVYIEEGIPDNGYVKPICLNDRRPQRRERSGYIIEGCD